MQITIPFDVEVRGKATSTYTIADIERRLAALAGQETPEAREEIVFLEKLKLKREQKE